jgi:hypothetical protein
MVAQLRRERSDTSTPMSGRHPWPQANVQGHLAQSVGTSHWTFLLILSQLSRHSACTYLMLPRHLQG